MSPEDRRRVVLKIWQAGVAAVDGYRATEAASEGMEAPNRILAVGKAAGAMAAAALARWPDVPALVVTKDGHGGDVPAGVPVIEAAHPVPDSRSLAGGAALRKAVTEMGASERLLLLISGGASSLAEDLVDGATLDDMVALNKRLLSTGLDIGAMNAERRKLSRIKGGGLLRAFSGAAAITLAISDVPGDDLGVIGSGIGAGHEAPEFTHEARIVASNAHARAAAVAVATAQGLAVHGQSESLHCDAMEAAREMGARIREMDPGVLVFGGEPTVVLPDAPGKGGRNQALALALAEEIAGREDLTAIVGGTDGSDGPTDAAGGIVNGATWGPGAAEALARADSGTYLAEAGALFATGPTGTNVMDLAVALRA